MRDEDDRVANPQSDGDAQRARAGGRRGLARPPSRLARDAASRPLHVRAAGRGEDDRVQRAAARVAGAGIVSGGGENRRRRRDVHARIRHDRIPAHHGASTSSRRATATIKALDVRVPAGLSVGYIMGVGDQVPPAIEQLGATVTLLDADDLASGNLSRFDAIVTGVRAYERRKDLRANNYRLLEYAAEGGVVIVQYNKFEFNQAQYGPYPAKVSADRVTDESAPVTVLTPDDPVLHASEPHHRRARGSTGSRSAGSTSSASATRGTSISSSSTDPFPLNAGPKRGALVGGAGWQRALAVRRPEPVAPAAGRHRGRLRAARQPAGAWRARQDDELAVSAAAPGCPRRRRRAGRRHCRAHAGRGRRPRAPARSRALSPKQAVRRRDQHARPRPISLPRAGARSDSDASHLAASPREPGTATAFSCGRPRRRR